VHLKTIVTLDPCLSLVALSCDTLNSHHTLKVKVSSQDIFYDITRTSKFYDSFICLTFNQPVECSWYIPTWNWIRFPRSNPSFPVNPCDSILKKMQINSAK
jgi:hypothetical protein